MAKQTTHNYLFRPAHKVRGTYPTFFGYPVYIIGLSPISIAYAVRNCTFTPVNDIGPWVEQELVASENMLELYKALKRIDAPTPTDTWCTRLYGDNQCQFVNFEYTEDTKPKWTDTWSVEDRTLCDKVVFIVKDNKGDAICILERVN